MLIVAVFFFFFYKHALQLKMFKTTYCMSRGNLTQENNSIESVDLSHAAITAEARRADDTLLSDDVLWCASATTFYKIHMRKK